MIWEEIQRQRMDTGQVLWKNNFEWSDQNSDNLAWQNKHGLVGNPEKISRTLDNFSNNKIKVWINQGAEHWAVAEVKKREEISRTNVFISTSEFTGLNWLVFLHALSYLELDEGQFDKLVHGCVNRTDTYLYQVVGYIYKWLNTIIAPM